jgi:hypothetical protein
MMPFHGFGSLALWHFWVHGFSWDLGTLGLLGILESWNLGILMGGRKWENVRIDTMESEMQMAVFGFREV